MPQPTEKLISELTRAQTSLFAYILALLPDHAQAEEVLQETNITIWRKASEFEEGTDFLAWSCKIAYFHVLSHRRRLARDRHVFSDELLDYLAERNSQRADVRERQQALRACLASLPEEQLQLVRKRYQQGGSVQQLAAELGKTVGAVSQSLYRTRASLLACIQTRLGAETS